MRYAKAPVVRFHDGNTDGDYDGGTQEGDNTLYYTHDANWNTTAVVDAATGAVAERYFYDAYGQAHFCNPSTWAEIQWSGSLQNEVLYGGYAFDAESGLYHTDCREYHGSLGRFVQCDPIGLAAGPNVYAYCNDSPADTVDPSGLEPDWAKAATGIMMVALSAMQTQAAISLGGSVFGMLGVTAGYGGFAAGMAMIVSAFSPDPRLDQVAATGAMIQLVASAPEFVASVIAAGGSMLRRGGAVFNGGVRSANPTVGVSGRATITETLTGLKAGRSSGVKVVGSEAELDALYGRLGAGGKPATPPTYKGQMVELPDGTRVGLRNMSTSGGKTIDIHLPDGVQLKVHIE